MHLIHCYSGIWRRRYSRIECTQFVWPILTTAVCLNYFISLQMFSKVAIHPLSILPTPALLKVKIQKEEWKIVVTLQEVQRPSSPLTLAVWDKRWRGGPCGGFTLIYYADPVVSMITIIPPHLYSLWRLSSRIPRYTPSFCVNISTIWTRSVY